MAHGLMAGLGLSIHPFVQCWQIVEDHSINTLEYMDMLLIQRIYPVCFYLCASRMPFFIVIYLDFESSISSLQFCYLCGIMLPQIVIS